MENAVVQQIRKRITRSKFGEIFFVSSFPQYEDYLQPIIEAMKENRVLNMTYHNYWKDEENNFDVQPYCVKLFRQRWYMVARSTYSYYYEKGPRIYSLDRIKEALEINKYEEQKTALQFWDWYEYKIPNVIMPFWILNNIVGWDMIGRD